MEAYFDNSATTRADEEVIEAVVQAMRDDYGNPSSKHMKGVEAEAHLWKARQTIASILKVNEKEIVFTSGGTESNNLALIGSAMALKRKGKHIITTAIEHDSVLKVCSFLESQGFEVTRLGVDPYGQIRMEELEEAIRPDTILVSVMFVNNEMGAVQDIAGIGTRIKKINPETVFHVDAVQAFGKMQIFPKKLKVDLMSVSGHKIHGPKGVGFLYINESCRVIPQILGGGQQKGMRSGTDNVPGISGLAVASENAYKNLDRNAAHMKELRDSLIEKLRDISEPSDSDGCEESIKFKMKINSFRRKGNVPSGIGTADSSFGGTEDRDFYAPHIVSVTFDKVKSEVLLHALEERGVYVSAGSACASNRNEISHTLTALGLTKQEADSTLRFSFSKDNTKEEVDYAVEQLKQLVPVLSRFTAR